MGVEMDGAMQHAPQWGRQSITCLDSLGRRWGRRSEDAASEQAASEQAADGWLVGRLGDAARRGKR